MARLRSGEIAAPKDRVRTPGVVLVGGGPGDPDLITVAGRRALQEADVVVADRLAPPQLLAELGPDVELIDATKLPRGRAASQEAINALLVERARAGQSVVRFKGGDPFVFGRGFEELLACAAAGVPCRVIPGITSAVSVPALAGVPVTHRGCRARVHRGVGAPPAAACRLAGRLGRARSACAALWCCSWPSRTSARLRPRCSTRAGRPARRQRSSRTGRSTRSRPSSPPSTGSPPRVRPRHPAPGRRGDRRGCRRGRARRVTARQRRIG